MLALSLVRVSISDIADVIFDRLYHLSNDHKE